MKKDLYEISSGNVFADLGLPNPEEMFVKADLAYQINSLIKEKKLTQAAAAKLLGIDQPKVSALSKGKLSGFSLERLFKFLNILGQDITISVTKTRAQKRAQLSVKASKIKKTGVIKRPIASSSTTALRAKKKSKSHG